jgi:hypothetical protein
MYDRHMLQCTNMQQKLLQRTRGRTHLAEEMHSSPLFPEAQFEGEIMLKNWMRLTRDVVLLGVETQRVMGLRWMKLSRGGRAAEAEAVRMVTEKSNALAEAGMTLARGGSAATVIRRYRTHVRANKRRLMGD